MDVTLNTTLTSCSDNMFETSKTDKTITITNHEFLRILFGGDMKDILPVTVCFRGKPSTVDKRYWFGKPWEPGSLASLPNDANNYFSLASFSPDETGQYRRKKSSFHALHAVMLDDLGTKVPLDRLTVTPSWLIETSPDNYQAGYILYEPITEHKQADQLMNAIIDAGLCDPGANGPTTRLARLPNGVNGKYTPPYSCSLIIWNPELRYSMQQLVYDLQLEIVNTQRNKQVHKTTSIKSNVDHDSVWIPCPEKNAVITALQKMDLYKSPLGSGRHDITCPWKDEHTDAVDSGTAYFEPDDNWPIGGFKCQHGHCASRHIRDLLYKLGVDVSDARMKPQIRIIAGEIHRIVDVAERELANSGQYYQRGGLIVSVISDPCTLDTKIQETSQPSLVRALAAVASWEKYDSRAKGLVRTDPPARHVSVLYDLNNYNHLPILKALVRQPYLRLDGSLMTVAGYDIDTGMFGVFDARKFALMEAPSIDEAKKALHILQDLLSEFPFADSSDKSAALSALLTATIRQSLVSAPMFHVRSHSIGSGKSYLCEIITAFATPQRGTPSTFPADDEECRKLLLAELMCGPAVIEFDNLTTDLLAHKTLCTALTSEYINGRILGISKTAVVSTRALFLSSGNNVSPIKDMSRRCITINLDPKVETPAARTFSRPNLLPEVLKNREVYVSAALTIIMAWIAAGKPMQECKTIANYNDWSTLCRQPLLWLGCPDPTKSLF